MGKSTISKAWARRKQGAVIEADYFTEWIYNTTFERFTREEEALVADLSFGVAKEYLKHGMPVAIEGVWSPHGLDILKGHFEKERENTRLKFVWLYCDISENHRRDEHRVPEDQMKARVDIVNEELQGYEWGSYIHPVDSTGLTITETIAKIEHIEWLTVE